jgi:hypothetical protein
MERTVLQTVEAIIEAASAKTGETVLTGNVPQGPLKVRKTTLVADNEVAREVLVRALRSTGYTLSWQLFYSASPGPAYYLNLHFVRPVE